MKDPFLYPKLRWPIDIRHERIPQGEILLLNCPLGIAPQPLGLIPAVGPVISCFEGHLSVSEIAQKFAPQGLREDIVRELVQLLDKHAFLASPTFFDLERQVRAQFKNTPHRPAALAGLGYSSAKDALTKEIEAYLQLGVTSLASPSTPMLTLMAPHIDYRRGKVAYAQSYRQLIPQEHDLYVLMGTSHQYSPHLFHLTKKNFETPLGTCSCANELVDDICNSYGVERAFADEFLHRREHSLELQLPFLRYLKAQGSILPILVGSFHHMLGGGRYPQQFEPYEAFAQALSTTLRKAIDVGKRICFIAGVDMAHIGRSFGDSFTLSSEVMSAVETRDRQYLDCLVRHDKKALFDHIAEDEDQRRICGFPTMYTILDTIERLGLDCESRIFDYRQAVDHERQCAVTFAGLGTYIRAA